MNEDNVFDRKVVPSRYDHIGRNTILLEENQENLKHYLGLL